mmetsp:Transcript_34368/g.55125  ORF Transcript_34368/g.55125 Transcript_34368/m.55125 type:complete len:275 (-) Transcript_34368:53-877(-)
MFPADIQQMFVLCRQCLVHGSQCIIGICLNHNFVGFFVFHFVADFLFIHVVVLILSHQRILESIHSRSNVVRMHKVTMNGIEQIDKKLQSGIVRLVLIMDDHLRGIAIPIVSFPRIAARNVAFNHFVLLREFVFVHDQIVHHGEFHVVFLFAVIQMDHQYMVIVVDQMSVSAAILQYDVIFVVHLIHDLLVKHQQRFDPFNRQTLIDDIALIRCRLLHLQLIQNQMRFIEIRGRRRIFRRRRFHAASTCFGWFLWWSWCRHDAVQSGMVRRLRR